MRGEWVYDVKMVIGCRAKTLVLACVIGLLVVAATQAESKASVDAHVSVVRHQLEPSSAREPATNPAVGLGAQCCSVTDGRCHPTRLLCPPEKIAVWCDLGEHATVRVNGDWTCS